MTRLTTLLLFVGLLAFSPMASSQFSEPPVDTTTPSSDREDRLPDGSSRSMAMVKDDQERSLDDVDRIQQAAAELKGELAKSEFLVSLKAVERAEEIEQLAKDIQRRLKRRR